MVAGRNTPAISRFAQHRPDREAVAHRLGHRDHVGHDAGVLEAEPLAGAAEPGLHLVHDQQQAALVAQRAHALEKRVVRRHHAALALHGLEQHCRHGGVDGRLQRGDVVERRVTEAVGHRVERFVLGRLAGGRERGERAPVEAAVGADHAVAAAPTELAGQLERCLVGLGAAVAEEHLTVATGGLLQQQIDIDGCLRGARVGEQVAHVQQRCRLVADRLGDHRVRVPEARSPPDRTGNRGSACRRCPTARCPCRGRTSPAAGRTPA